MSFCTKCGRELRPGNNYCGGCGKPVNFVSAGGAQPNLLSQFSSPRSNPATNYGSGVRQSRPAKSHLPLLLLISVILLLIAAGGLIFFFTSVVPQATSGEELQEMGFNVVRVR